MGIFGSRHLRSGQPEWDGQQFALDDPRIPLSIRQQLASIAGPGDALYFAETAQGGEWWLLDDEGELIEAFWLSS